MGKLKPCPFCGKTPIMEPWHGGDKYRVMVSCINESCHVRPGVVEESESQAIEFWNKREK